MTAIEKLQAEYNQLASQIGHATVQIEVLTKLINANKERCQEVERTFQRIQAEQNEKKTEETTTAA